MYVYTGLALSLFISLSIYILILLYTYLYIYVRSTFAHYLPRATEKNGPWRFCQRIRLQTLACLQQSSQICARLYWQRPAQACLMSGREQAINNILKYIYIYNIYVMYTYYTYMYIISAHVCEYSQPQHIQVTWLCWFVSSKFLSWDRVLLFVSNTVIAGRVTLLGEPCDTKENGSPAPPNTKQEQQNIYIYIHMYKYIYIHVSTLLYMCVNTYMCIYKYARSNILLALGTFTPLRLLCKVQAKWKAMQS